MESLCIYETGIHMFATTLVYSFYQWNLYTHFSKKTCLLVLATNFISHENMNFASHFGNILYFSWWQRTLFMQTYLHILAMYFYLWKLLLKLWLWFMKPILFLTCVYSPTISVVDRSFYMLFQELVYKMTLRDTSFLGAFMWVVFQLHCNFF